MDGTGSSIEGFPLSPQQARLWSLAQSMLLPQRAWIAIDLAGVDAGLADAAVAWSVARHEVLRTAFVSLPGMVQPLQSVRPEATPERLPATGLPARMGTMEVLAMLASRTEPANAPPLCHGVRPTPVGVQLFLGVHLLCADQGGLAVLADEIAGYCRDSRARADDGTGLLQYVDLSDWLNERLQDEASGQARQVWQRYGTPLPAQLPEERVARSRAPVQGHRAAIDAATVQHAVTLAARLGVDEEAVWLAGWRLLLARLCAQDSLRVRVARDGRRRPELAQTVGPLCRWLPSDADVDMGASFATLVSCTARALDEADAWQDFFDPTLPSEAAGGIGFQFNDLRGALAPINVATTPSEHFKLALSLTLGCDHAHADFAWDPSAFPDDFAPRLAAWWRTLMTDALAQPEHAAGDLQLVDAASRRQLLVDFNASPYVVPSEAGELHRCFERQALLTPTRPAVRDASGEIDYADLNDRANRLARHLREAGAKAEIAVGICLPRSIDLVVALLAVAKSGAAYVPLDPELPVDRLDFMIRDTAMPLVITRRELASRVETAPAILAIDAEPIAGPASDAGNFDPPDDPTRLAYVIYTSGSTGRPKGVQIEHRQLTNYLHWACATYPLGTGSGAPVHTAIGFDATITSLFPPLMTGGCLEMIAEGQEIESLARILRGGQRHCLFKLTPAHLEALGHVVGEGALPGAPACFVVGGEALAGDTAASWRQRAPGTRLINEYGPTETVVGCSIHEVAGDALHPDGVPIGRPIANTRLYVLDPRGQLLPPGVAGEIHIGGAGVARGYLNQPELTSERFLPDPFAGDGARMYRSGDLGRWRSDGVLEFLGRVDEQIKLRGHRVEPGEIEACLRACDGVEDAAIACDVEAGGAARLVAFVRSRQPHPGAVSLQRQLERVLPAYMVPSAIVTVETLPLTPNGKLDRKALLAAHRHRATAHAEFQPPSSADELLLARMWSDVLRVDHIGRDDSFFALGGDSIRAIQLRARLQQQGRDLPLQCVMGGSTLAEMAAQLQYADAQRSPDSVAFGLLAATDRERLPQGLEDAYPASQLQLGMLFHSAFHDGAHAYVDVDSLHVRAALDVAAMRAALQAAVDRHPVLRTSFALTGYDIPLQLVHSNVEAEFQVQDWRGLSEDEQSLRVRQWLDAQRAQGFDSTRPGLLRVCVALRSDDSFQFGLSRHHAILDGWSAASLMTELVLDYGARIAHADVLPIEPPRSSFRDFIANEVATLANADAKAYWQDVLRDASGIVLSRDGETGTRQPAGRAETLRVPLASPLAGALAGLAREQRTSLKNVLLAAHLRVLSLIGATTDVTTGLVVDGRMEQTDGDRALGLFLNTVPLRAELEGGSWRELVREVARSELELMPHRRYPLARIQAAAGLKLEILFNFVHFHVFEAVAKLPGFELLATQSSEQTSFSLLLNASQDPATGDLALELHFDPGVLGHGQVRRIAGYYTSVLEAMAADPDGRYELTLALLDAGERQQLLHDFNATAVAYPDQARIHELFQAQVGRTP
ncbi:non-ribosomal peptide synthetase, partial [Cognatiluteimonas telluris]|uniref:non-ribosomal peptide synthetase n=1 Tax=Cognatiluteimonas telluris TaxID=1104775 RepID=UPI00140D42BB